MLFVDFYFLVCLFLFCKVFCFVFPYFLTDGGALYGNGKSTFILLIRNRLYMSIYVKPKHA